ncbi:MAG: hypothetical protein QOE63_308 [Acidimicrobiaceae bacterium]|jgi:uncharacterized protein YndB with AHSA1/START domain
MRVTRDVVLTVDTAVAWELLTDPDDLAAWLGALGPDGTLAELDGTRRRLVVDHVDEGRSIGFVWWGDDGAASRVELQVDEHADGSKVTVTETVVAQASVGASGRGGGTRRLALGPAWDGRLLDLELRSLQREPALVW